MLNKFFILIICIFITYSHSNNAQTFGFGCLGFVGGYGGFSYQKYNPAGLNEHIREFNLTEFVNTPIDEFSTATGYRLGLNFFRATFENGIIVTAKGFYQALDKKNKGGVGIGQSTDNYSLDIDLRNLSLGFDIGWQFTKVVSWKIIDGSLNFNNVKLTETTDLPGQTTVKKYDSEGGVIGYSIGTGIIVAIYQDYVSIEGLAGYTHLEIDDVFDENGIAFLNPISTTEQIKSENKFINSGGFSAVIQLNVGLPLL